MAQRNSIYKDFSDMPVEVLVLLANDMANPKAALRRIRAERKARAAIAKATLPTPSEGYQEKVGA